jgi:predicted Zn-dependent protease
MRAQVSMTRPVHRLLAGAAVLAAALTACATVPYTGRRQLALVGGQEEVGGQLYGTMVRRSPVSPDARARSIVEEVGHRIADVAERPDWRWEFTVFHDDDQVNAWALPGGKVGIYTGIFPVARSEAGLAVIVGHEVAHALANHAGERASQSTLLGLLGTGLSIAASGRTGSGGLQVLQQAYGLGAQFGVLLPFGRAQESEADEIGLILMAKAGYDPRAALDVWERMAEVERRQPTPPEFLSTHPSYGTRIARIRESMPQALDRYRPVASRNRRLPTLAELTPPDPAEQGLLERVDRVDRLAAREPTARTLPYAIASEFRTSPEEVVGLAERARLTPGETALALAIRNHTGVAIGSIVDGVNRRRSWFRVVRETGAPPHGVVADLEDVERRARSGGVPW